MPAKKQKRLWPALFMLMITDEDIVRDIIERVREEFSMAAPADEAFVAVNRGPEHQFPDRRAKIEARVEELCAQTAWTGDLDWVHVMFHPEASVQETRLTEDELATLPPFRRLVISTFFDIAAPVMLKVGYGTVKYRIVNWITDYAIEGDYIQIKPMPFLFEQDVIEIPFLEDKLVVALVSRFADVEDVVDRLRTARRRAFAKRKSNADPENIERNTWAWIEYQRIQATFPRRTHYRQLLLSFGASRWAYQLDEYDLDTYEDQQRAYAWLRGVVRRGKQHAQSHLPEQPSLFRDEQ